MDGAADDEEKEDKDDPERDTDGMEFEQETDTETQTNTNEDGDDSDSDYGDSDADDDERMSEDEELEGNTGSVLRGLVEKANKEDREYEASRKGKRRRKRKATKSRKRQKTDQKKTKENGEAETEKDETEKGETEKDETEKDETETKTRRKAKKPKDPNAPKRPQPAFIRYCADGHRAAYKASHPKATSKEVQKQMGVQWKALSGEEKKKYSAVADAEMEKWKEATSKCVYDFIFFFVTDFRTESYKESSKYRQYLDSDKYQQFHLSKSPSSKPPTPPSQKEKKAKKEPDSQPQQPKKEKETDTDTERKKESGVVIAPEQFKYLYGGSGTKQCVVCHFFWPESVLMKTSQRCMNCQFLSASIPFSPARLSAQSVPVAVIPPPSLPRSPNSLSALSALCSAALDNGGNGSSSSSV